MKKTGAKRDKDCEHTVCAIANGVSQSLLTDARQIIDTARANAVRSVDFNRVMMYWNLGRRIFEEEQQGKDRAEYGARVIRGLAERLEPEYGSGFGLRQLEQSRKFYRLYPIAHTLYAQLNWSQYKLLISIDDAQEREYYQLEAVNHCWTKRELERQIHSQLWERLCLSNDKEAVLAVARKERIPETPQEIIKDPMRLEFLGLEKKAKYYESDLEQAIIDHLQGKRSAESATTASSSLTARKCSGKCAEETPCVSEGRFAEGKPVGRPSVRGASLNHLGKKCFAFSSLDKSNIPDILAKI